jgi:hypothetical protein
LLQSAFLEGQKANFQITHYALIGNHLHLLAEADDARALGRGLQGLGIRMAHKLNKVMERRGAVVNDRYHAHILRTPSEIKRVRSYLLSNAGRPFGKNAPAGAGSASQAPIHQPRTLLVRMIS